MLKGEKDAVMFIKPGCLDDWKYVICGHMSCPSRCSQHQVGFMFGEHTRKRYNPECLVAKC